MIKSTKTVYVSTDIVINNEAETRTAEHLLDKCSSALWLEDGRAESIAEEQIDITRPTSECKQDCGSDQTASRNGRDDLNWKAQTQKYPVVFVL